MIPRWRTGSSVAASSGKKQLIHRFSGQVIGRVNKERLVDGRSSVCAVAEDVDTVVLWKNEKEVARLRVQLQKGEVTVVRR